MALSKSVGVALLFTALVVAASVHAQEARRYLSAPEVTWLKKPSGHSLANYYPREARLHGVTGTAVTSCRVSTAGLMEACTIVLESPEGAGFGKAALKLMSLFRMAPTTKDGRSVAGYYVVIPVMLRTLEKPAFQPDYGYRAFSLTPAKAGGRGTLACPAPGAQDRRCELHDFNWDEGAQPQEVAQRLSPVAVREGLTLVQCDIVLGQPPRNCDITGAGSPDTHAAVLALATQFRAPKTAADGTSLAGASVVTTFDWAKLAKVIDVLAPADRTAPTAPAPR